MLAVSNTSPISNLAVIGHLPLLRLQFSEIRIPPAVLSELNARPDQSVLEAIRQAIHEEWIQTAVPKRSPLLGVLSPLLHRGEAEAITLASEIKAGIVIFDEHEGPRWGLGRRRW